MGESKAINEGLEDTVTRAALALLRWPVLVVGVKVPCAGGVFPQGNATTDAASVAAEALNWIGGRRGRLSSLPLASGWTRHRDLPVPQGRTFQEQWKARRGH